MKEWTIYADELQEGDWFKTLHARLANAVEEEMTGAVARNPKLAKVLIYDRPDVILTVRGEPILVVERTIEVPSGHNVGQRFARLAAAAEARVPVVYFGPYAARKHGGATAGPRYMNLRLFAALDHVSRINRCAVTCINWPVDHKHEISLDRTKDDRLRQYLAVFFHAYDRRHFRNINDAIIHSTFEAEQLRERERFASTLRRSADYKSPPASVVINSGREAAAIAGAPILRKYDEVVMYTIGMRNIRSDPYTGMAMLYKYLYVLGVPTSRLLILCFPHITHEMWRTAAAFPDRKDIRLFRLAAGGILFKNNVFVTTAEL